jgi:hypothetical protein
MEIDQTIKALGIALLAAALTRSGMSINILAQMLWQWHALKPTEVRNMTMDMTKMGRTAAAALFLLALAMPLFTMSGLAASSSPYEQQILQARYDMVSARVSFATGVLTDTSTLVANASDLNAHVDKLNGDLNTLKGYVNSNDKGGFDGYVSGTIQPDMQASFDALKADMKQFKAWGVSAETIAQLKADYQSRKSTFEQQTNAATIELGNIRLSYYNDVLSAADDHMAKLSARGIDVSGMQSVKAGAESKVVSPLQSAVSSGDASAVKEQLKDKCIANGAPYSYHIYAKLDLEALKAVSAKVSASTNSSSIQQQLAAVNEKLSSAEGTLNMVGTNPYTADQQSQVWDNLKAASDGLKEIIKELNGQNTQG